MKAFTCLLIAIIVLISSAENSYAARQYRCNGKIQYRPCLNELASPRAAMRSLQDTERRAYHAARNAYASDVESDPSGHFAKITKHSYKRLSKVSGQWRGIVEGNGTIRLTLHILRNGEIESSRFMGEVALRNKKTSFNFISSPPQGTGWSYKIIAIAS